MKNGYYFVVDTRRGLQLSRLNCVTTLRSFASKAGVDEIGQLIRAFAATIDFCVWLARESVVHGFAG